jgi:SpoVK/Ycf46/Vps4 family AAA+-type ATPase
VTESDFQQVATEDLFELRLEIPIDRLKRQGQRLIGFSRRYDHLHRDLRLLMDREGQEAWSKKYYHRILPLLDALQDRYPLVIFHGDVGTGKTATAEACADELARELGVEGTLFKLSTRVRGTGMVGQMTSLIARAFEVVTSSVGKKRLAVLIIDEADSLGSTRNTDQSHHEDKAAVNTLIQKIDDVRAFNGRVLVILCTNRYATLDPAILRRAGIREEFRRPDESERRELFDLDCDGLGVGKAAIDELVRLTGPIGDAEPGFTYSDIRTRLLPEALGEAFPDRKLTEGDLLAAAKNISPSPSMETQ